MQNPAQINYNRRAFILMLSKRPQGYEALCRSLLMHLGGLGEAW